MKLTTLLKDRLKLKHPLIVAPMAGGPSSVDLVATAIESGALGSMGAAYTPPADIGAFVQGVRHRTSGPLAINLFIPTPEPKLTVAQIERAREQTAPYRKELGLPDVSPQAPFEENFDAQFEATLALKPEVLSFVFGLLPPEKVNAARDAGIYVIGTATTLDEASALAETGVDAVTLQGFEAGGHRGLFSANATDPETGILELLRGCAAKLRLPLIAAGGLMSSEDIRQALQAGAQAVQMGTAFLGCKEAGTSAPYRRALFAHAKRPTRTTRVFSGRLARGLENRFLTEMEKDPSAILPFPAQNQFTRDLRRASAAQGSADFLSLWCGAGSGTLWRGSAAELIAQLFHQPQED